MCAHIQNLCACEVHMTVIRPGRNSMEKQDHIQVHPNQADDSQKVQRQQQQSLLHEHQEQ